MTPRWFAVIFLLFATPLLAWTPRADQRITGEANRLAPKDLKLLLDVYAVDYQRGLDAAAREESGNRRLQHFATRGGKLQERLDAEIREAVAMVKRRDPMRDFVYRLGIISHLVADMNNPFHVADSDPRMACCKQDYESFVERKLPLIRPVFYGLEGRLEVESFIDESIQRTIGYYPLLTEEYFRGGRQRSSKVFDERSTAFGVASLTCSHSVTDLVNVYFHVWRDIGGSIEVKPAPRTGDSRPAGGDH